MNNRIKYLKRIIKAYLLGKKNSNLSFWHTSLKINNIKDYTKLGRYYMNFVEKTKFQGPFDAGDVPMLDYKGDIGIQYNPNAVAQYALGLHDLFIDTGNSKYEESFLKQANWFLKNIRVINGDVGLWEYKFDFEYHKGLKTPWHSALAQGQGISVLVRAYLLTKDKTYLEISSKAFNAFKHKIDEPGGVTFIDDNGYIWFEELIFNPPTHVLNGFIYALWGVYDYYLVTKDQESLYLFKEGVRTLKDHIGKYDIGFWSVYHLVPTKLKMIASPYYQRLHILQLKVMYKITGEEIFLMYANKWKKGYSKIYNRVFALLWKSLFKLIYY